jgi:hypothetical protein
MAVDLDPQLAIDEQAITDADLEAALERRLRLKDDVAEVTGSYKRAHEDVLGLLAKHPPIPEDAAYRVGRFRIAVRHVKGRSVSFDTEARNQLTIGLVGEDGQPVKRQYRSRAKEETVMAGDESVEGKVAVDDTADLRPTGEVNADALRGEAERSVIAEPMPIKGRRPRGTSGDSAPVH